MKSRLRPFVIASMALGIVALSAIVLSHLALTDIWHGEGDARLEWLVVRVALLIVFLSQVIALIVLGRVLTLSRPGGES